MNQQKNTGWLTIRCANCGKTDLAFEAKGPRLVQECPVCRLRTTVYTGTGQSIVFSERQLLKIFSYARSRKWTCPEHDGTSVVITGMTPREGHPLQLVIRYLCKPRQGWRKPRAHSGTLTADMLTLESEMRAAASRKKK